MNITITGVVLNNTVLYLNDASATIRECTLLESSPAIDVKISKALKVFSLDLENNQFVRNHGCIEINFDKNTRCNRVMLNLKNVSFQENTFFDPLGLVLVKGKQVCGSQEISVISVWKNVSAFDNIGSYVQYENKKRPHLNVKTADNTAQIYPTTSLFVVQACKVNLTFTEVRSSNNTDMRFLNVQSFCSYIYVYNSSYHGHKINGPGGVIYLPKGKNCDVTIKSSDFVNNVGTTGGVLQIEGGINNVVNLTFRNVTFLYSYGALSGCVLSVGHTKRAHGAHQLFAKFDDVVVKHCHERVPCESKACKKRYAAICLTADEIADVMINNSLFYRNANHFGSAVLIKHQSIGSLTNKSIKVHLENTRFFENVSPLKSAAFTVTVVHPHLLQTSSLRIIDSIFWKNRGMAIKAQYLETIYVRNLTCNYTTGCCLLADNGKYKKVPVNATVIIEGSTFINSVATVRSIQSRPKFSEIRIYNTTFCNNNDSVVHITVGPDGKGQNNSLISGKVVIDRVNFTSNFLEHASTSILCLDVSLHTGLFQVVVRQSVFQHNYQNPAKNSGGISSLVFMLLPDKVFSKEVSNQSCPVIPPYLYHNFINFEDVTFSNNTASSSVIYINNGKTSFLRCEFRNSFSHFTSLGANVLIEEGSSRVEIVNSSFLQTRLIKLPHKAGNENESLVNSMLPFVYSGARGPLVVRNTNFILDDSERTSILFVIQNSRFVHFDNNTNLVCPIGSFMTLDNTSHVIQRQISWDNCLLNITRLKFICKMCPVDRYTLQRGSYRSTTQWNFIHYIDCPYGGQCWWNIKSISNFWGYITSQNPPKLKFNRCPEMYCSEPTSLYNTSVYNSCYGNRTGIMCGECKEGFTESIFNHKCRSIDDCKDGWF